MNDYILPLIAIAAACFVAGVCSLFFYKRNGDTLEAFSYLFEDGRSSQDSANSFLDNSSIWIAKDKSNPVLQRALSIDGKSYDELQNSQMQISALVGMLGFLFTLLMFGNIFYALVGIVVGAALGWSQPKKKVLADFAVSQKAMVQAVSIYQELASAAVAGGSNTHSALSLAVDFGEGPQWAHLRNSVRLALTSTSSLSEEFRKLARTYDVVELDNLANLVAISEDGAISQASLQAMSEHVKQTVNQNFIDESEKNSSKLIIPIGLIFSSFILFMGYVVLAELSNVSF